MWDHLKNINLLGTDNNPNTPTSAYDILCHYKNLEPHQQSHTPYRDMMFFQSDNANNSKIVLGNYGR